MESYLRTYRGNIDVHAQSLDVSKCEKCFFFRKFKIPILNTAIWVYSHGSFQTASPHSSNICNIHSHLLAILVEHDLCLADEYPSMISK